MKRVTKAVLAIDGTRVAALIVHRTDVVATAVGARIAGGSLETDITALLGEAASGRAPDTLEVLVGRPHAHRKALFGEEATVPLHEVSARLHARPEEYFLGGRESLIAGEPHLIDGAWWVTALDRGIAVSVGRVCSELGIGHCRLIATPLPVEEQSLFALMRRATEHPSLDPSALDLLAAERQRRATSRRLQLLGFLILAGLASSALAPLTVHRSLARRDASELAVLERAASAPDRWARRLIEERRRDLARIERLEAFAPRRSALLGTLGAALPESAVVVSLAFDTTSATMVVLAPPGADVVASLRRSPGVIAPRLTGAVTRERMGERDVERSTLAFGLSRSGTAR